MGMPRRSIAGLMGIVVLVAFGLAALRDGTELAAGTFFLVTCGVLAMGVVGAVCRRGADRAGWLGFSLFGWGYLFLAFHVVEPAFPLPTMTVFRSVVPAIDAP